jgi:cytochrome c553
MRSLVLVVLMAFASYGVAADGKQLFQKCIACHGVDAQKSALGKSKIIANMSLEENIAALKGYQDGTYGGTMKALMKGQVSKYTDEEIEALAKYITTLGK